MIFPDIPPEMPDITLPETITLPDYKCDLCKTGNGDLWYLCSRWRDTGCTGASLHFCKNCAENRKQETETVINKKLDEYE